MVIESVEGNKGGISFCVFCVGIHPDKLPSIMDYIRKMAEPGQDAMAQWQAYGKNLHLYKDKSCVLCGRTYDSHGECDETWELTAKRVKEEFENAGVFGVSDSDVKLTVAECRKAFLFLLKNRMSLTYEQMERSTFTGRLVTIITSAQNARHTKVNFGKGLN